MGSECCPFTLSSGRQNRFAHSTGDTGLSSLLANRLQLSLNTGSSVWRLILSRHVKVFMSVGSSSTSPLRTALSSSCSYTALSFTARDTSRLFLTHWSQKSSQPQLHSDCNQLRVRVVVILEVSRELSA
jgi:hypothetical protein